MSQVEFAKNLQRHSAIKGHVALNVIPYSWMRCHHFLKTRILFSVNLFLCGCSAEFWLMGQIIGKVLDF